ncbi:hypothetical protein PTTG_04010 [Puccinia triticina 1-1 BBBD Race 1]|uniref:ATP synthase mitochondrial F1 complex assembly factor 2 n=2 Tax=Puccinia triticina TaxID=208348 RepID=A0A180GVV8_PUCT1|nr:uncharacterized protein PtA15_7A199 [Puccinia triticina]OAV96422.1 hypothetical protein PTTG_04010 [Puccinia triticina 1-1 BBBD Race 1]WAQ86473.1 hypothetical protein PtA15_7A199 [Puccinia triticina]WAR56354.1 hypothetical protein PtB15_7B202 [Puccinia triticina]
MQTPRLIQQGFSRTQRPHRSSTTYLGTSVVFPCGSRSQSTVTAAAKEPEIQQAPQTTRAETSLRRFWKTVDIHKQEDGQYSIRLDLRNLKTPGGKPLVLPKSKLVLATLIAREWDEQRKILKQHSLPMTSLASRAIDGLNETERETVIDDLMRYLDTDTICFQESKPRVLAEMQKTHWAPLLAWLQEAYQIDLKVHEDSILYCKQSPETHSKMRALVVRFDALKLAAFERAVHATKSFVIALALVEGRLTVEQASDASRVEVLSQISRWGEVEDTHDVDYQEIRMKLGSVRCVLIDTP